MLLKIEPFAPFNSSRCRRHMMPLIRQDQGQIAFFLSQTRTPAFMDMRHVLGGQKEEGGGDRGKRKEQTRKDKGKQDQSINSTVALPPAQGKLSRPNISVTRPRNKNSSDVDTRQLHGTSCNPTGTSVLLGQLLHTQSLAFHSLQSPDSFPWRGGGPQYLENKI